MGLLYLENNVARVRVHSRPGRGSEAVGVAGRDLVGKRPPSWRTDDERGALAQPVQKRPLGVSMIGLDQRYVATNPAYQRMTGYSEAELRSRYLRKDGGVI